MIDTSVVLQGSSDHDLVVAKIRGKVQRIEDDYKMKRSWRKYSKELLEQSLKNCDWSELYITQNIDVATSVLTDNITNVLDTIAPVIRIRNNMKFKEFISEETKEKMDERDNKLRIAKDTRLDTDWTNYKITRNEVSKMIKKDKKNHDTLFNREIEKQNSTKYLWDMVKSKAGWIQNLAPTYIQVGATLLKKKGQVANCLNDFYVDKIENIRQSIVQSEDNPLSYLQDRMEKSKGNKVNPTKFSLEQLNLEDINKIIDSLTNSTATGTDRIPNKVIKDGKRILGIHILRLVNLSLAVKTFPTKWKIGKLIPLYKNKGSRYEAKNYRPVCLLPALSKILEKAVHKQLNEFMERNGLWHPLQFAYRKEVSTANALLMLHENWMEAIDKNEQNILMMIDLSSAFDVISHDLLLDKLECYRMDEDTRKWIRSYLTYRSQYVQIGEAKSNYKWTRYGVPQGSILGPLFYLFMTNELPSISNNDCKHNEKRTNNDMLFGDLCNKCGITVSFADDSNFSLGSDTDLEMLVKVNKILKKWISFCNNNYLKINSDKTGLMRIASRQKLQSNPPDIVKLNIRNNEGDWIRPQDGHRILGCNLSKDLTWGSHLLSGDFAVIPSIVKKLGALKLVSRYLTMKSRLRLANGIIMSRLLYLIQVWGCASKPSWIQRLQRVQNKAAQYVTKKNKFTKISILLSDCNWMSILQLIQFHSLLLFWKTVHLESGRFLSYGCIRKEDNFYKPRNNRILLTKLSWKSRSILWWNELPDRIRNDYDIVSFKGSLRAWIFSNTRLKL